MLKVYREFIEFLSVRFENIRIDGNKRVMKKVVAATVVYYKHKHSWLAGEHSVDEDKRTRLKNNK